MGEYIDKNMAVKKFENYMKDCQIENNIEGAECFEWCVADLHDMTAVDVAPVVRCKDCQNWNSYPPQVGNFGICQRIKAETDGTDFCSYGERKEEQT